MSITKNLGRIGFVLKGEYDEATTYNKLDVVTIEDYGSYVSKVNNNIGHKPTDDPEYWQPVASGEYAKDMGDYAAAQGRLVDDKVADITRLQGDVAGLNRDMGKYQQLLDVTLTLVESGKRFTKDGVMVADSAWNVGRLGAVSKGNIYELLMGGSDKMVLGTALFVSHTIERIGGQDKDVYKPIFSAVNVDLPISTYAVLLAGEDYSDVIVSYRNDVAGANTMKVARWGIFASIATQLANLRGDVDLKSFSDGYYDNMGVGYAKNLIGDGEATAEEFTERVAGGSHQIDDSLAEYVTINGNSVVKNQLIKNSKLQSTANWNMLQTTSEIVDGVMKVTINQQYTASGVKQLFVANDGDIILRVCCVRSDESVSVYMGSTYANIRFDITNQFKDIYYISKHSAIANYNDLCISGGVIGTTNTYYIKYAFAVNLSKWYNGAVPEGLTAEQFIAMNPDVLTMPYTEPHVVNMTAEGVKTTGRNLWDEEWVVKGGMLTTKNYINVTGCEKIFAKIPFPTVAIQSDAAIYVTFYDDNLSVIKKDWRLANTWFVRLQGTKYIKFSVNTPYGTTYNNDIAVFNYVQGMSTDYEPHVTSERKWTETMNRCFPEGMAKAGNVYDEMGSTKAVKRIGRIGLPQLQSARREYTNIDYLSIETPTNCVNLTYGKNIVVCNKYLYDAQAGSFDTVSNIGKLVRADTDRLFVGFAKGTSYEQMLNEVKDAEIIYELAEPIVTTYDELNLTSRVWRNGMEEIIVPEGKESSPISADVIYQINAFKTIKANKQGIEELNAKPAISLTAEEVAKLRTLIANTQNLEE